ncbi:hypothetical protein ACVK00_001964 [Burkholderia sp. PvR073]|uniref:VOC family protein n=1 Tax=Burkholderia TaxID=32008 RepID=UPI00254B20A8|nr:VOC family protein [Burkholderia sp. lyk4-R2A-23]
MHAHLRIARPVADLSRTERMYRDAFELSVFARFDDHDGFSGAMLGREGLDYHFEFTRCLAHPVAPSPTPEDLIAFYLPDHGAWEAACARAAAHGFMRVASFNPYWDASGQTCSKQMKKPARFSPCGLAIIWLERSLALLDLSYYGNVVEQIDA